MLRTQSLILRPFRAEDTPVAYEFMRDADAMRYTYIAPSLEDCSVRLNDYEAARARLGFAPWVVLGREGNQVIGWGGLSLDLLEPEWGLEVSYAFNPSCWGRGYATELVQHSVAHAFGQLAAQEVHAFAAPANLASVRVLQKCGFTMLRYEPSLKRNHYLEKVPGAV